MTERVNLEAMTGRELDALVAERVCGWTDVQVEDGDLIGWHNNKPLTVSDPLVIVPYYSATWAGMGLVVEAMIGRGYHWWARDHDGGQQVLFQGAGENCAVEGFADTAPRATTIAALRAAGGET